MHGSGGEKWKRSQHMWPVPNSTATTVAVSDSKTLDFFCKDGRKIRVGDCALFKPPQDSPPFIGIIRRLTLDKEDTLSLGVNWLYRPADIRLAKGILQDAALNEVFYSFHKDEIPAASLLHPCKVAFLRKGVELPPGISSFVCRRVYDTENKCLWWLTDKDYINERQEEVDQLLDKTRLEMHGGVQSGGRSPKPLNGPSSTPQLKSGSDSVQNSASSFSSQAKGKKRERGDQGSDSVKRERLSKIEDGDSGQFRPENMLKSEIAKITDKGGLVDFAGVEKLVQLMQPDSADKKIDLAGRIMLVDVIAVTDRYDCLGRFVQLRGLPVLDEWLQEVHKGKIGDGSSPKESDKSVEEFLLALLRALDKLPVNLHALKSCNVGKSVNHLRSHKNSEIQKKARTLVDTWKRRVEAEMNMNDAKSGSGRGVSWPNKPASSEVSHVGSKKTGNSIEVGSKTSNAQPSVSKAHQVKLGSGESASKSSASPGSTKPMSASVGTVSKDQNFRMVVGAGSSDLPLTPIKEEKSSSSSQSQNNSQSSDHAKTVGSSCREDARSSTAGSVSVNKVSSGGSRHRKSSNGLQGSAVAGVQKEIGLGKVSTPSRNLTSEKPSTTGVTHEKLADVPPGDHGNNRIIVRFPNTGRSPARGASGSSFEDTVATCGRASPPAEKHDNHDKKTKGRNDAVRANISSDINSDLCQGKEGGFEEVNVVPACVEQQRAVEDGEKPTEVSKAAGSLSKIMSRSGKSYEASLSCINALIESCAKISEASASTSPGDDVGMNLLASVAAGEISKSDNVSPSTSPGRNPSTPEGSSSGNDGKLKQLLEEVSQAQCQPTGGVSCGSPSEQGNTGDSLRTKNESGNHVSGVPTNELVDMKGVSPALGERAGESSTHLDGSLSSQENVDALTLSDLKPAEPCDVSVTIPACAKKEGCMDAEGSYQFHEQRNFGVHRSKSISSLDSKLKIATLTDEDKRADKKADCADERTVENSAPMVSEAPSGSVKVEKDNEKSTCSSSEKGGGDQNADKELSNDVSTEQKPSLVTVSHAEHLDGKSDDQLHCSGSGNTLNVECKGENADDVKAGGLAERTDGQTGDIYSSNSDHDNDCGKGSVETKESVGHSSVAPAPCVESPPLPVQENELNEKPSRRKIDGSESSETEEQKLGSVNASGPDSTVKLDFDLNEGFPSDDGGQGDLVKMGEPGSSSAIHLPCPLPFQNSSISGGFPASITVAAPAKGAFYPPENPLRSKGELGWKGSAATSAFRPAEPRKTSDTVDSTVSKGRAPLDFDLNVPDDRAYEDESGVRDRGAGAGGLDLDLNRVDESPDVGPFSASNHPRLDIAPLPTRSSLSSGLSNGTVNASRDFDLNNGPGLDEVATEAAPSVQPIKSSIPSAGPVPGIRANNTELGNFSAWFPPGNAYSAIAVPPIFPGRGEQSYVAPAGSQRVLCPPNASASFVPEIYRGPVLSSSPAVAFPPATQIPYPGFPFETSFPLSSNSFSGCSPAYMESSSGGALCFPTIPSPLVGPAGVVSSAFPRPYVMNLPGGASNIGPDGRKWGSQGLDLNAGPGSIDTERRDERLPSGLRQLPVPSSQALVEEQIKMFQVGGVLKRKEPDSGLDAVDRISYKQPSWQ
ncbi:Transcription elongation factor [Trema orientale]|uniref:Transcription elongation factor n=1 Tax=Trema orientale TaxID=63057 RepID=A0A2P5DRR3_TREOI|nr:Transcription elongation factor [Trema orientale]